MTTAKLSGDKLKRQNLLAIYQGYLIYYNELEQVFKDLTTNKIFTAKVFRQLDSAREIIRREYEKSISVSTCPSGHKQDADGRCKCVNKDAY